MDYITATQAADALGVSVGTIYRYLNTGRLQGEKMRGTHWRIPQSGLESLMARESRTSDAEHTIPDEHNSADTPSSDGLLPGEGDFISWITREKKERDKRQP